MHKNSTRLLLLALVLIITFRMLVYYMPDISYMSELYIYNTRMGGLDLANRNELLNESELRDTRTVYYLGRGSCGDCRACLKKILELKKIADQNDCQFRYVELAEDMTQSDRNYYIDNLGIDEIPMILYYDSQKLVKFHYKDIICKNYKQEFQEYLGGVL